MEGRRANWVFAWHADVNDPQDSLPERVLLPKRERDTSLSSGAVLQMVDADTKGESPSHHFYFVRHPCGAMLKECHWLSVCQPRKGDRS